jgi:hypothetical protein
MGIMALPPKAPDHLPQLEHEGVSIEVVRHYGFTTPKRGQALPRMLYAARNPSDNERHWRRSYDEIVALIDRNFVTSGIVY